MTKRVKYTCEQCGGPALAGRKYCGLACRHSAFFAKREAKQGGIGACITCGVQVKSKSKRMATIGDGYAPPPKYCDECRTARRKEVTRQLHRDGRLEKASEALRALWRDPVYREKTSMESSARMKRRRNGGDPELNAILAKRSSERLKKAWTDPVFRAARVEESTKKAMWLNSDPGIVSRKKAGAKWIMRRAWARVMNETRWQEVIGAELSEWMAAAPWDGTKDYGDYLSELLTNMLKSAKIRTFIDPLMSQFIRDSAAEYRLKRTREPGEDGTRNENAQSPVN